MPSHARFAPFASALLLAASCGTAHATTTWICGLSSDLVQLICVADGGPEPDADVARKSAVVRGTSFPLDTRRTYVVPMWSPPTERAWVELLARATICYRTSDCEVVMAPGPLDRLAGR